MHGRFPTHNKYFIAHEIFPYLSKQEKKDVYFPSKDQRSKKISKQDLKMSKEDQDLYEKKYKAKK